MPGIPAIRMAFLIPALILALSLTAICKGRMCLCARPEAGVGPTKLWMGDLLLGSG